MGGMRWTTLLLLAAAAAAQGVSLSEGDKKMQARDFAGALAEYDKAVAEAPEDPRGYLGRAIALNVFRESVRDKVLYNLVLFAVLLMGVSYLIGQLTAGQDVKIIKDLGLSAMSVFGLFIAIFIGIGLVSKEVERKSVYALLAKPIRRRDMVVGKYAGEIVARNSYTIMKNQSAAPAEIVDLFRSIYK